MSCQPSPTPRAQSLTRRGRSALVLLVALSGCSVEIDQQQLLGIQQAQVAAPEAPKEQVCTIRTRRGAEVVEIPIPCTN